MQKRDEQMEIQCRQHFANKRYNDWLALSLT